VQATLSALARTGAISAKRAEEAIGEMGFNPEQRDPSKV
jgi:hypothetical protein